MQEIVDIPGSKPSTIHSRGITTLPKNIYSTGRTGRSDRNFRGVLPPTPGELVYRNQTAHGFWIDYDFAPLQKVDGKIIQYLVREMLLL